MFLFWVLRLRVSGFEFRFQVLDERPNFRDQISNFKRGRSQAKLAKFA